MEPKTMWLDYPAEDRGAFLFDTRKRWAQIRLDIDENHQKCRILPENSVMRRIVRLSLHELCEALEFAKYSGFHSDEPKAVVPIECIAPSHLAYVFANRLKEYTKIYGIEDTEFRFDLFELEITENLLSEFFVKYSRRFAPEKVQMALDLKPLDRGKIALIPVAVLEHILTETGC